MEKINKIFTLYLLVTAVVCGALVMVIEVMGSRVIGPFFGVSLFVWTSLITVTLVALACGYAVGGIISDRHNAPKHLYAIILVAALFVLLIPLIKGFVIKACVPLGLRGGAFVSTLVLFGPALFLLGCVSPYLVKISANQLMNLGKVVGGLYALSTIGSTLGTVVTGFFLIAYLGVDSIFYLIGSLLILLAVVYFVIFERRVWGLAFLLLPALLIHPADFKEKIKPDGTKVSKIYHQDSYYGQLKVVDYSFEKIHIRELMIDGMIQGGVDMNNRLPIFRYSYYLQFLSMLLKPKGRDCLVFGLGIGTVPNWYESRGITCDVVDIDPNVFHVAKKYFGFEHKGKSYVQDARYFLEKNQKQYDYVVLDVFNGDITPAHLVSQEALKLIDKAMAPGAILAINLIGSVKDKTFMTASVVKTLQSVFKQVEAYPVFNLQQGPGVGNIIILAYQGPQRSLDKSEVGSFAIHPRLEESIRHNLGNRFSFPPGTPAMILTDEYNPIDFYDSWLREANRQKIIDLTDWDLLIS